MIGHKHILEFFDTAVEKGTLSHAYLLVGPEHVGKRTLANTVTASLLDIPVEKITLHPDVRVLTRERNEKTGKLQKDIRVSQIRDIRSFATAGPLQGNYSVVIIDGAEYLSKSAANGLLKTLEEPHKKTVIFLTVTDTQLIPETIISRSQVLYMHPVTNEEITVALPHITEEAMDTILEAAAGLPGIACALVASEDAFTEYTAVRQEFFNLFGKPLHQKRQIIEHLFNAKDDHIAGREVLVARSKAWKLLLRHMLLTEDTRITSPQGVRIYDTLEELEQLLKQNVHPRAAVDSFLLTIP